MIRVQFLVPSQQTARYNIEPQDTTETKNIIKFGINHGKTIVVVKDEARIIISLEGLDTFKSGIDGLVEVFRNTFCHKVIKKPSKKLEK